MKPSKKATRTKEVERTAKRKFPTSTVVNFTVLIILFAGIFLFQRYGNRIISGSRAPESKQEVAAVSAIPEENVENVPETEEKTEAEVLPVESTTQDTAQLAEEIPVDETEKTAQPEVKDTAEEKEAASTGKKANEAATPEIAAAVDKAEKKSSKRRKRIFTEAQLTVEELDNAAARQRYLATNRVYSTAPTKRIIQQPPPDNDFIPFERINK